MVALMTLALVGPSWATSADPYVCYQLRLAAGSVPFVPVSPTVEDFLSPSATHQLRSLQALCDPAALLPEFPQHPGTSLVEYRTQPGAGSPPFATRTVEATDEFGTVTLAVGKTISLLVPSNAQLGGTPPAPYSDISVRHYACHRAKAKNFTTPPAPFVSDQLVPFGGAVKIQNPTKLCAPANTNGEDPSATGDPSYLVCYRAKATNLATTQVSTNNQVRPETLDALEVRELCVPGTIAGGPTTTSTTVVTTTSTTTTTIWPMPCGDSFAPVCWGECPPATPICASGPLGCGCVAGSTPCGSSTFPTCDGACGPGEACAVSLTLGCTCEFQGLPCGITFPECGGACSAGQECAGPFFTPDGNGCACVPEGSTCHLTCDPSPGSCPVGMSCMSLLPGFCGCQ
jgi:hypothetical protein